MIEEEDVEEHQGCSQEQGLKVTSNNKSEKESNSGFSRQLAAALALSVLETGGGMAIAWSTPIQVIFMSSQSPLGQPISFQQFSIMISAGAVGVFLGTISHSWLALKIPMKNFLNISAIVLLICWVVLMFSPFYYLTMLTRIVMGFAQAQCGMLGNLYISSISYQTSRGTLITLLYFGHHVGFSYSYIAGPRLSYKWFTGSGAIFPTLFLFLFLWFPESPVYLVSKCSLTKARKSLMFFRANNISMVEKELKSLRRYQEKGSFCDLFRTRANKRAFEITNLLAFFSIFCGCLVITAYTFVILKEAESGVSPDIVGAAISASKFTFFLVGTVSVDKLGRRPLLFISYGTMALSSLLLGLHFKFIRDGVRYPFYHLAPCCLIVLLTSGFSTAAGFMYVLYVADTLPPLLRPHGLTVVSSMAPVYAITVLNLYPFLVESISTQSVYWIFCTLNLLALLYSWFRVPETKNLPIEKVVELLDRL